jgi:hypothetical protein
LQHGTLIQVIEDDVIRVEVIETDPGQVEQAKAAALRAWELMGADHGR